MALAKHFDCPAQGAPAKGRQIDAPRLPRSVAAACDGLALTVLAKGTVTGTPETERSRSLALLRGFKVLAHETGHMFSLPHCTVNECLMNGSNSLNETDRNTIHLCPVCLHKLQWNLKFEVARHYRQLEDIYRRNGYEDEAGWTTRRLASLPSLP
jgi:hypothetical protein